MKKTLLLLFLLPVSLMAAKTISVNAQSASNKYVWEYVVPPTLPSSLEPLRQKVTEEVNKVVDSGHLAPFRTLYGESYLHYFWTRPADIVYALSSVYPYLDSQTQSRVSSYLKSEIQNYPLWNTSLLNSTTGTKREPDIISATERGNVNGEYGNRPKLFNLYALWKYYQATKDLSLIQNNWSAISNFYNTYRNESTRFYGSISGSIGMARLARAVGQSSIASQAESDAISGMNAGNDFSTFSNTAENTYKLVGDWDGWIKQEVFIGFHFYDLTAEMARYMNDTAQLRSQVIGSLSQNRSYTYGNWKWPLWWSAQGSNWSRYYGEGSFLPPDSRNWLFPISAWVVKEPLSKLQMMVDVPDALVGDVAFLINAATTFDRSGTQTCWMNLVSQSQTCQ